ncbi:hypothetical protein DAPPUDRAFT_98455 [Daphnia pulex]|uniref:Uncharacterized protein n=1 Tax=Daphnia pulex TaxID=6669 RepID=E9G3Q9_DAPPU|nr:hypothetical protein DAPPUDRAFT_98455 [Daphnia pulex]|eukprot:EFX85936.1 hypothetical protein DAPPUDRAFT_98455 [Daphnia pulex]
MTDESAGRRINPFFIHGGGTTTATTCNHHQDFAGGDSSSSSDDDPWKTSGMPGMIGSRHDCSSVKANGVPSMTGGAAGMVDVNVRQRNAVGIIKWIKRKEKKPKKKKKTLRYGGGRPTAGAHLRDFMHATSMHGLKYAAEKEATWIERRWGPLISNAGQLSIASYCQVVGGGGGERLVPLDCSLPGLLLHSCLLHYAHVVQMGFLARHHLGRVESTDFPNSMISFPTVSVCNVNQVSNAIVLGLIQSKIYREANMSRENLLDLLGGLMRGGVPDSGQDYITQLEDSIHLGDLTSANLTFFMRNVAQPCSQMLLYCEWQSRPVNCSDIFQLVPSNQGFCCVYNLQTVHLNRKRNRAVPAGQQPVKAHGEGVQMGLTVLLDAQIDDYALTSSFFHGFKVLIHHPEDQPDPSTKGFADDFYQKDVNCPVNCNTTSYTADISRGHFPNRDFRASRMARNTKALINDTYLQLSPNRSCNPETFELISCFYPM